MDTTTNGVSGSIQLEKLNLGTQNTELDTRKSDILARADDYRQKLIDKYSNFESQIAASKTILAQIQAILNASSKN